MYGISRRRQFRNIAVGVVFRGAMPWLFLCRPCILIIRSKAVLCGKGSVTGFCPCRSSIRRRSTPSPALRTFLGDIPRALGAKRSQFYALALVPIPSNKLGYSIRIEGIRTQVIDFHLPGERELELKSPRFPPSW